MRRRRRRCWSGSFLAIALAASGCAMDSAAPAAPGSVPAAAARLAIDLAEADAAIERAVGQLDAFGQRNRVEAAAIAYATGSRPPSSAAAGRGAAGGISAVEAAGDVLEPAFEALSVHGRRLAALVGRVPPGPPPPDPAELRREAEQGLAAFQAATRRPLPPALREAGLAAIPTLVAEPAPGTDFTAFVTERQPAVEALAALARSVIGTDARSGLRAVLASEQAEAARAQAALMAAARRDRAVGVLDRYALYHSAMGDVEEVPAEEVLAEAVRVLDALPPAHAALAQGDGIAAGQQVAAFSAAVDRLEAAERGLARAAH